jgi:cysteine desulfurase
MPDELADGSLRLCVGRFTTDEEVEVAATLIRGAVERVRALSCGTPDTGVAA